MVAVLARGARTAFVDGFEVEGEEEGTEGGGGGRWGGLRGALHQLRGQDVAGPPGVSLGGLHLQQPLHGAPQQLPLPLLQLPVDSLHSSRSPA